MKRPKLQPPKAAAVERLVHAVHDLSADPNPENVRRYLAMSRALEASRFGARKPQKRVA
jgi:hypothetical protein